MYNMRAAVRQPLLIYFVYCVPQLEHFVRGRFSHGTSLITHLSKNSVTFLNFFFSHSTVKHAPHAQGRLSTLTHTSLLVTQRHRGNDI